MKKNHDYDEIPIANICVTFCTNAVTDRVLQQKHVLAGETLTVQKVMEDETDEDDTDEEGEEAKPKTSTQPANALKISGFKPFTHDDVILMYFESTRKSGGGEIAQFEMSKSKDSMIITFTDPSGTLTR